MGKNSRRLIGYTGLMAKQKLRVISYARDLKVQTNKFREFDNLLRNLSKDQADGVAVASPQILGDNYEELVANLNKLATANLLLAIVPPNDPRQN